MNNNDSGIDTYAIEEFIHYASKYYDPVKAHEYYMQNRELKGRRKASDLNEEGKSVWRTTKTNIASEKKASLTKEKEAKRIKMEVFRRDASAKREGISKRLREVIRKISDQRKFELGQETKRTKKAIEKLSGSEKKIAERENEKTQKQLEKEKERLKDETDVVDSKIASLLKEDYSKLPDAQRIRKIEERKKKLNSLEEDKDEASKKSSETQTKISADGQKRIDDIINNRAAKKSAIREKSSEKKTNIRETASKASVGERDTARQNREAVSAKVKMSLDATREAYAKAKQSIKDGFETTFQKEFDAIKAEYGKDAGNDSGGGGYTPPNRTGEERRKIRRALAEERKHKK